MQDQVYNFAWTTQIIAAFAATINSVSDGIHYGWASPVIPILTSGDSPISITETDVQWLELLYMIGGIAGLPLTMFAVDKFGRKKSILLASANNLLSWILIAVANNVTTLHVARFLSGLGADVAFVAIPMYIAEIADQKIRGLLVAFIYIMLLIGIVICYSVAPFVSILASSSVGAAFVIAQLITLPFMPETPYYNLLKGKEEAAEKSLKWLRRRSDVKEELEEIKAAVARQSSERGKFKDIFIVPSNRKALIIMTVLNASQHLSSISVMLMNLHTILEDAEGIIEKNTSAIIFAVIMLIATVCAAGIVDKCGRKLLLVSSSLISSVALGSLAVYLTYKHFGYDVLPYNWVPIAAVFIYAASFRMGLGSVPIVLTGELFPTSVKAKGMTLSDFTYVFFGTITIYLFQILEKSIGIYVAFYIFSISCILAALFTVFFVPETKGKTLEQIQLILKGQPDVVDQNVTNPQNITHI
ncbi:PREDICTED: facilitated trehalose transporter Tret1-like [Nicrophorus vespilloides]|uniref:Facilitated trehalose transporter Tret1-like n=1 Tax=Nicrophorus vespilloides TaxID=110193 RepID=A0ABM1MXF6_NICVS|nr:PREDICTED: facilitated trehalose transporter Tret1-like [Nicrophorus vespilloides]